MTLHYKLLIIAATSLLITSCGNDSSDAVSEKQKLPTLSAATLGEQLILDTASYLQSEPYASANRQRGSDRAMLCMACHSLEAGGANMIGPALHGMFGREAGSNGDFDYSPVLKNAKFIWTPRALDAWLAQPASFLPGNRMAFAGVPRQQDRDDLIAFLLEETSQVEDTWN